MRVYAPDTPRVFVYPETPPGEPAVIKHPVGEAPMLIVNEQLWYNQPESIRKDVLEGEMTFLQFLRYLQ